MDTAGFQKGANSITSIVKGLGIFELLKRGLDMVTQSVDAAVSRVDTLNRFPKIMEQMGYGADAAGQAIDKLSAGIEGLPTTLDQVVSGTQRMALILGDVDKAADSALALNNALFASGATAELAASGTEQYVQALSKGKPDMIEWRSMLQAMPYAIQQVATSFGYEGSEGVQLFGEALRSGEITMTQFNAKLIELNSGAGGFAELAQTAAGGISTSWQNVKTAVVKGVANMIQSLDEGMEGVGGIAGALDSLKKTVNNVFAGAGKVVKFFAKNLDVIIPIVKGLTAAFVAYRVAVSLSNLELGKGAIASMVATVKNTALTISTMAQTGATLSATTAQLGLNAAMKANVIGLIIAAVAGLVTGLVALAKSFRQATPEVDALRESNKNLKKSFEEVEGNFERSKAGAEANAIAAGRLVGELEALEAQGSMTAAEQARYATVVEQINELMPGVNAQINEQTGLLEGGTAALRDRIEAQKAVFVQEAFIEKNKALYEAWAEAVVALNDAQLAQSQNSSKLEANYKKIADATGLAVEEVKRLAEMGDSSIWSTYTDELGEASEETFALWQESYNLYLENELLNGSISEGEALLAEYDAQISEAEAAMASYEDQMGDTALAEAEHAEKLRLLGEQYGMTSAQVEAAAAAMGVSVDEWAQTMAEAQEASAARVEESLGRVVEAYYDSNNKIDLSNAQSLEQRIENIAENQRLAEEYANNLKAITDSGLDLNEGLLAELEAGTPEAMALAQQLVESLGNDDGKWEELNELYGNEAAGLIETLGEALTGSEVDIDMSGVADAVTAASPAIEAAGQEVAEKLTEQFETTSEQSVEVIKGMMEDINTSIKSAASTLAASAKSISDKIVSEFSTMSTKAAEAVRQMMAGMLNAMNAGAGALYSKANEIANQIAATLRAAWDEHSPSRVFYNIMDYAMQALYNSMDDSESRLFGKAGSLADGIAQRMQIAGALTPEIAGGFNSMASTGVLSLATATAGGVSGGSTFAPTLIQYVTTPKPWSESELSQQNKNMFDQMSWQIK